MSVRGHEIRRVGAWFGASVLQSRFALLLCWRQFAALVASRWPYVPNA